MKNAITLSIALATTLAFSGMALAETMPDPIQPQNKTVVQKAKIKHAIKKFHRKHPDAGIIKHKSVTKPLV